VDLAELAALRAANEARGLAESELPPDPYEQFRRWHADVHAVGLAEPDAMVLATTGADSQPLARNVLLRGLGPDGFVFYTNYDSRKGRDLAANPRASLLFSWVPLGRQVQAMGPVTLVSAEESEAYWVNRPRRSQLAAWASEPQSGVIANRATLERRVAELDAKYPDGVPRPPFWGGYRLTPDAVEFWQGRADRMHDRLRYVRDGDGWRVERLAP
jgi:pyridoxamine 5'-phosphate oxidase